MRIGLVVPGFDAHDRDDCVPALGALARRLSEDHHVRIVSLRYPYRRGTYRARGLEVTALGGTRASGLRKLPLLARALLALRRLHERAPFDVLHGIWADEPGFVAVQAGRFLGVPAVVTLLGGELVEIPDIAYGGRRSRMNRFLIARSLAGARTVTAGSSYLETLALDRGSAALRLPLGVDTARFRPKQDGENEGREARLDGHPRLLHVASLVPVKDQATLLDAFARASRDLGGAVLHVVGDGPLAAPLRRRADSLGVGGRVRFHGRLPHRDLPPLYRAASVLVMSSRHEGQEWVTLEAAACARPAVGTRVGVLPDLEPATVAVDVSSPEALAGAIVRVAADPARAARMGEAARRRVVRRYSLDVTVARLVSLYSELTLERDRARNSRNTSFTTSRSATTSTANPFSSSASTKASSPSVERQTRA